MFSLKLDEFVDTRSFDKLAELYEVINEERLSAKDTGINYRVINHWDEKGIIRFGRENKEHNRKFSFTDFIWIKVVDELRSFGVRIEAIKKVADDIFENVPMKELYDNMAKNISALDNYEGEDKAEFIEFLKSGGYNNEDFNLEGFNFHFLHILIAEAIATRESVSIILFKDGEWIPFLKANEHLYPKEILHKIEFSSQIRINITNIVYAYILEDYLVEYFSGLFLYTKQEANLLYYVMEGDFQKIHVFFKSKKEEPIEIAKSKSTLQEVMQIFLEKEYKDFILIDKKGKEIRIRQDEPTTIMVQNNRPGAKRKYKFIKVKDQE
ncbi:MAG: MerR family transcriptional regulator [Sphingobacteriaceae bacterium]